MPRKKKTAKKNIARISENLRNYFLTGDRGNSFEIWSLSGERLKAVWQAVENEIVTDFIKQNPCCRPWAWWEFSSPRWKRKFDAYFDGKLPEPRKRLGGVGDANFEFLNYVPRFKFGLPTGFVSKFDVQYYNGVRKDIHGEIISTRWKPGDFSGKAIDPDDPPLYESEAAYLQRHGLLTKIEKIHLEKNPALLEPEKIEFEKNGDEI